MTDMAPSLQDQRRMNVPLFPPSQLAVGRRLEPILARQSFNIAESHTLAALRDTLLPKLLSGELRVKDAEKVVAEAAA
jgi:type I restriction enzyme, S subunit